MPPDDRPASAELAIRAFTRQITIATRIGHATHLLFMTPRSIYCLAPSRGRADRIIHDLKAAEFARTEIGTLFFDRSGSGDRERDSPSSDAAAQSAGPIRGGLAWIAGIGRLVVPGIGAFFAAGPIIAALHQARNGTPGVAIARGLVLLGVPQQEAARYEQQIRTDGHLLISVHSMNPTRIIQAQGILTEAGAQDIVTTADSPVRSPAIPAA
jgi:hypothetical protein